LYSAPINQPCASSIDAAAASLPATPSTSEVWYKARRDRPPSRFTRPIARIVFAAANALPATPPVTSGAEAFTKPRPAKFDGIALS